MTSFTSLSRTPSQSDFQKINLADLQCLGRRNDKVERAVSLLKKAAHAVRECIAPSHSTEPIILVFSDATEG